MKILEITTLATLFGSFAAAENIPLCAFIFAVSLACGFVCLKRCEREGKE